MKDEDLNKELCGLLGICWHEEIGAVKPPDNSWIYACRCGCSFRRKGGIKIHIEESNPDFSSPAGIVELLGILRKKKDWRKFYYGLDWSDFVGDYLIDKSSRLKLMDTAIKFLKEAHETNRT